jgi:hypothetical protein
MKLNLKQWVAIGLIALTFIIALIFTATHSSGWTWGLFSALAAFCVGGVLFVLFSKKFNGGSGK